MKVASVDSYLKQNGVKCVVYGGPGVGKTRLCLTAPRPLYLSTEEGYLSLRDTGIQMLPPIITLADLVNAHNWILQSKEAQAFDTICIDSVSELAENILRVSKSASKDGRMAHENASELVIVNIFNSFRDLPRKHVYCIAKEQYVEDTITKIKQFRPSMPNGKMVRELPYKFDFVFRFVQFLDATTGGTWEGLQCNADATAVAKDRSGKLNKWEPPNLGNLFAKAM